MNLAMYDLLFCVRRLPGMVRKLLKDRPGELIVAGGFVRACVAGEQVSDIDIMSPTKDCAQASACALSLANNNVKIVETGNAFTVCMRPTPVQFVHRWTFATAKEAINSFDFTIARGAFWWDGTKWQSEVDDNFYADLAAKRLVYCSPIRIEEAGGSLLRVLKFYQKGYRIPLDSLAAVVARLTTGVEHIGSMDEVRRAKIMTGLLREVDPLIDPDHIAHLASLPDVDQPSISDL